MSTYTIGAVAERSGFSASALRYYEEIGLVTPATRSDSGYRLYDDRALARLAFIGRAKQLGCSLQEITDLVELRDGERCGPVQRRFHELVSGKIAAARRRATELAVLTAELRRTAAQLAGPAVDGPCAADCACLTNAPVEPPRWAPVSPVAGPVAPMACTLEPGAVPDRVAAWRAVLDRATSWTDRRDGGLRLGFDPRIDVGELARLVAAEQRCCTFLAFAITVDTRGVGLEVHAPDGARELVAALFGSAAA